MAHEIAYISGSRSESGVVQETISWWCSTHEEVERIGAYRYGNRREKTRSWNTWDDDTRDAGFRVDIVYEGIAESEDVELMKPVREFDGRFSEEPIEKNPYLEQLKLEYGAYEVDKKIVFPEYMPPTGFGLGELGLEAGLSADVAGRAVDNTEPNPMFGWTTYPEFACVFRETRVWEEIPKDLLDNIGKIVAKLPDNWPTPDEKDWLTMAPRVREVGDFYEVVTELLLSPRGGWPKLAFGIVQV